MKTKFKTKSVFSFNIDIELKKRLGDAAFFNYTTIGPLLNKIIESWLNEYDKKDKSHPIYNSELDKLIKSDTGYDESVSEPF